MSSEKFLPLVYIIILNWNGKEHLEYCIPTVLTTDYPNFHILLVDNGSTDDSVSFVKQRFPGITVICNKKNLGYAKGNNIGIKYALKQGADYIVILNNDMKVDLRWISEAVKVAEYDEKIGLIGFKVFGEYEEEDENKFKKAQKHFSTVSVEPAIFVTGCALFIKKEVLKKIGLFDEGYFLYADEEDLELRLQRAGFNMKRLNIPLWHKGSGSVKTKKARITSTYHSYRSYLRFLIKNYKLQEGFRKLGILFFRIYFRRKKTRYRRYYQRLRSSNFFLSTFLFICAAVSVVFSIYEILKERKKCTKMLDFPKIKKKGSLEKKIKVMHIIPGLGLGGAETSVVNLLKNLRGQDCEVALCSLESRGHTFLEKELERIGIRIYYLNMKKHLDWRVAIRLFKIIGDFKPLIVHTHLRVMRYSLIVGLLRRVPLQIHTVRNVAKNEFANMGKYSTLIRLIAFRWCKVIPVSISKIVAKTVKEVYRVSSPIIHNGIPIDKFTMPIDSERSPKTNSKEKIRFVNISNFRPEKNHQLIVEAFKLVNKEYLSTELVFVGDGNLFSDIKKLVKEKNLDNYVSFLGHCSDIPRVLKSCDIFVFPSEYEGFGLVTIEAMLSGIPVIATPTGIIPELVKEGINGFVVPFNNVQYLASKMLKLAKDENLRKRVANRAREEAIRRFDITNTAKGYKKLYVHNLHDRFI